MAVIFLCPGLCQFSPIITRSKTSDRSRGQKNEKKKISLVGIDERFPRLPAVFLCELLDHGFVGALPFFSGGRHR